MAEPTAGDSGVDASDPEDVKIITLARASRARTGAAEGAAVRDTDGRTYAAASVALPSLKLTALQVAEAMAVSSGAPGLEAAAVVTDEQTVDRAVDHPGLSAVRDLAPAAPVFLVRPDGQTVATLRDPAPA